MCNICFIEKEINNFNKHHRTKDGYVSQCKDCCKIKRNEYYEKKLINKKIIKSKVCTICFIEKDLKHFHKSKKSQIGHVAQCKECRKIKSKKNYQKSKTNVKKIVKNKICSICYIEKDVSQFHKQMGTKDGYRSHCKECRSIKFKETYKYNDTFFINHKERTKTWRTENRDKYNNYFKKRYKKIPHIYAWRGMLNSVIKRMGTNKEKNTYDVLGYSAEELKNHIESLFLENMSWDNWGEWHIDHIRPISSFDKTESPKIINALENLQPLWAIDNIKKGNKF